jgi:hypothetical protein
MSSRLLLIFILSAWSPYAHAQANYPVIGKAEQQIRDNDRRAILQEELAAEREALAKAQAAHDAGPTSEREAAVHRHTENIKALLRELDSDAKTKPEPMRVVVKATRPASQVSAPAARNQGRFWDPYNRAPDVTDFSTTPRRENHEQ